MVNKKIEPCTTTPLSKGGSFTKGVFLCILCASLFAVSILFSKVVYQYGVGPLLFGSVRAVFAIVICAAFIAFKGGEWLMPKPSRRYILPMSVMLLMVSFGHPTAMKFIPASLASLLFYLWPMLVLVIFSVQNRQFPGIRRIAIFAAAFVGLGLVFGPSIGDVRWEGIVAALIAALGAGFFIILIPKATKYATSMTININTNIPVALILFCGAVLNENLQVPTAAMGWYALLASGLLYGAAMVVIFYAVTHTGPVISSVLFNAEPLIVTLLATMLFAEILQPVQYMGILTVVAAMMFASARSASHGT